MTAALFTLCALWPCEPEVRAGGGLYVALPTGVLAATLPVADRLHVQADYALVAGLLHDVALTARTGGPAWEASLGLSHGFFALEETGGVEFATTPLGNGVTSTAASAWRFTTDAGTRLRVGAEATLRLLSLETDLGTVTRRFDPLLHSVGPTIRSRWSGGFYLHFRGLVPIGADLRVLGYLPLVTLGQTWSL